MVLGVERCEKLGEITTNAGFLSFGPVPSQVDLSKLRVASRLATIQRTLRH
jgi:hypothetical protein